MRVSTPASIAVKNHEGVMAFGSLQWIDGQMLQVQADSYLSRGQPCEIRLELTGTPVTVYAHAEVVSVDRSTPTPSAVCRIREMSPDDRTMLAGWIEEVSQGGARSNPARWLDSVSGSRAEAPASTPQDSTVIGRNRHGRESVRQALLQSVQRRRTPESSSGDPRIEADGEGRVTVTWRSPVRLAEDMESQLKAGALRLPFTPASPQFTLRLALPDGQILALPATAEPAVGGSLARFFIGLPLRQKIKRVIEGSG